MISAAVQGKVCSGCLRRLGLPSFSRDRSKPDGHQTRCKPCRSAKDRDRHQINGDAARTRASARYLADKPAHRRNAAAWAASNPEKLHLSRVKWREANRATEREAARIAQKSALKERPERRLNRAMSRAVWGTLKGRKQGRKWCEIVGYSQAELISHLERHFIPGMTWSNYGEWHVDHNRPIVSFDFTSSDDVEFKICWSLGNLRPLWAKDNLRKNRRWLPAETMEPSPTVTPSRSRPGRYSPVNG